MAIHSGFFNSVGGDRKYDAEDINKFFTGVITDGVLSTIGDTLFVVESTGMQVAIGSGKAWFLNSWIENTADAFRTLSASDVTYDRIDIIALDFDKSDQVRINNIIIVEGTPASSPVPPTLLDTGTHLQKPLAYIDVGVGVTAIYTADITIKVDTVDCPFSSGITDLVVSVDDVTIEIVGNDLQVKNNGITSAQIAAGQVDTSELAADAVTGAKIENDAINSEHYAAASIDNEHYALNSIDDDNIRNRIPMMPRRQGGSATNWDQAGTTDYTPTTVKTQIGIISVGAVPAGGYLSAAVTFPQAYPSGDKPHLMLYAEGSGWCIADQSILDNEGFTASARNLDTAMHLCLIHWVATGKE